MDGPQAHPHHSSCSCHTELRRLTTSELLTAPGITNLILSGRGLAHFPCFPRAMCLSGMPVHLADSYSSGWLSPKPAPPRSVLKSLNRASPAPTPPPHPMLKQLLPPFWSYFTPDQPHWCVLSPGLQALEGRVRMLAWYKVLSKRWWNECTNAQADEREGKKTTRRDGDQERPWEGKKEEQEGKGTWPRTWRQQVGTLPSPQLIGSTWETPMLCVLRVPSMPYSGTGESQIPPSFSSKRNHSVSIPHGARFH